MKLVTTNTVIPYARNPRKNDAAVAKVAGSIKEFGFKQPIVVDKDMVIVAGHTRLLAALQLDLKKVPIIIADDLSEQQIKAYRIADNRVSQESEWDFDLLKLEMDDLLDLDFDLLETGFNQDELDALLNTGTEGLTDEDEIPEDVEPIAKLGDVWQLGAHRLVCGDSTDPLVVEKALNGVSPHLMVTDPPYGVNYDPEWRDIVEREEGRWNKNNVTTRALGKVENDDRADWSEAWALFPGDIAYIWHEPCNPSVQVSLLNAGFEIRSQIIWVKQSFVFSRGHYHWQHEPCWYAVRKGSTGHWSGDRKQSTVWEIRNNAAIGDTRKNEEQSGHGTQKPVECMRRPIVNNSSPGQAIYEPFCGSGTTIIAGETEGRTIHAIEINPEYVDIAVKRWENFTGLKAELEKQRAA